MVLTETNPAGGYVLVREIIVSLKKIDGNESQWVELSASVLISLEK